MATNLLDDWLDAWNSHDGTKLADLLADDGIYEVLATGRVHSPLTVVQFVEQRDSFSSDFSVQYVSTQRDGNMYSTEWVMTGTKDRTLLGWPATGTTWTIRGASIGVMEGERIKRHREYWDLATVLGQLGLSLPPDVDWALRNWAVKG